MTAQPTVVAPDRNSQLFLWLGFPLLGAVAGWLLKQLAGWASTLAWIPFQGPLELIDSLPELPATVGAIALGLAAGVVIALLAAHEMVNVTVDAEEVVLGGADSAPRVRRSATSAAFVDGKQLVLLGHATEELARKKYDLDADDTGRLERAFLEHGWPWRSEDPHQEAYQRWVEGMPDLPKGVDAILAARRRALERGDQEDAAQLRTELAKLGVVVRDEKTRQFYRRTSDTES